MTKEWLAPPDDRAAPLAMAIAAAVPVIATPRLRLRAPVLSDFSAYRDVFTIDRAEHMGGPFSEAAAFPDFCQGIAGRMLRGAGMWTLTQAQQDAPLGWICLWQEPGDPEPEPGWVPTEPAEDHGYATEAARHVLPQAVALFGADGFVSHIDAANLRSARLARKLGARRDASAEAQMAARGEIDLHVYRHSGTGMPA